MGYAPIRETNWKVYIGTLEEDALDSLVGLRKIFALILFITFAACILAAWIFISHFSKSVTELDELFAEGAKEI